MERVIIDKNLLRTIERKYTPINTRVLCTFESPDKSITKNLEFSSIEEFDNFIYKDSCTYEEVCYYGYSITSLCEKCEYILTVSRTDNDISHLLRS